LLRVLVADDHPGLVKGVSRLLGLSYDVVGSVEDGADLLAAVQHLRPDVIVLDLSLPNVDALNACHHITQIHPGMKVIVFTAMNDPDVRQRALDAGASAYVQKLGLVDDLLTAVARLDENRA
jgi:DNA-binding NarL/FixJ family response regulator